MERQKDGRRTMVKEGGFDYKNGFAVSGAN